jgi:hypothetical protein
MSDDGLDAIQVICYEDEMPVATVDVASRVGNSMRAGGGEN